MGIPQEHKEETDNERLTREMEEMALRNANRPPEDITAEMFKQYYPVYKSIITGLGKADLCELADELVKMPDGKKHEFYHPKTQLASQLGAMLLNCKAVMMLKTNMEALQQAYDLQTAQEAASPSSSENNNVMQEMEHNNG